MGDHQKGKTKNKEKEQITRSHHLMREGKYTSHQNVGLHYRWLAWTATKLMNRVTKVQHLLIPYEHQIIMF